MSPFPYKWSRRGSYPQNPEAPTGKTCDGFQSAVNGSTVIGLVLRRETLLTHLAARSQPTTMFIIDPATLLEPPMPQTFCVACDGDFKDHKEFTKEELDAAGFRPLPPAIAAVMEEEARARSQLLRQSPAGQNIDPPIALQSRSAEAANALGAGGIPAPRDGPSSSEGAAAVIKPYVKRTDDGDSNERRNTAMREHFGTDKSRANKAASRGKKKAKEDKSHSQSLVAHPSPSVQLAPPAVAAPAKPTVYLVIMPLTTTKAENLSPAASRLMPSLASVITSLPMQTRDLGPFFDAAEQHGLAYAPTVSEGLDLWTQLTGQTVAHLQSRGYRITPGRRGDVHETRYGLGPFEILAKPGRSGYYLKENKLKPVDLTMEWYSSATDMFEHPTRPNSFILFIVPVTGNLAGPLTTFLLTLGDEVKCPGCIKKAHGCVGYRVAAALSDIGPAISDSAEPNPRPTVRQREGDEGPQNLRSPSPMEEWEPDYWAPDYDGGSHPIAVASTDGAIASTSNAAVPASAAPGLTTANAPATSVPASTVPASAPSGPTTTFIAYDGPEAVLLSDFVEKAKNKPGLKESLYFHVVFGPHTEDAHKVVAGCVWAFLKHEFRYLVEVEVCQRNKQRRPVRREFPLPPGIHSIKADLFQNLSDMCLVGYPFASEMAVGVGFNAAVRGEVLNLVKEENTIWRPMGSGYLVLNPQPDDVTVERQAMSRAAGWVFAWVLLQDVAGVGFLSPFLLMALMCEDPSKLVISPELLRVFDRQAAEDLDPWLRLGPKERIGGPLSGDKARDLIIAAGGNPEEINAARMREDSGETHLVWTNQLLLAHLLDVGQGGVSNLHELPAFKNLRKGLDVALGRRGDGEVTFIQLFREDVLKETVLYKEMDISVAHYVTALCDSQLKDAAQVTERLEFEPSVGFKELYGENAHPTAEDCLKRLFLIRLEEFLRGTGIPDDPTLGMLYPQAVNDETIQQQANNPVHRARLFLRAFSSAEGMSSVTRKSIMIGFDFVYPVFVKPKGIRYITATGTRARTGADVSSSESVKEMVDVPSQRDVELRKEEQRARWRKSSQARRARLREEKQGQPRPLKMLMVDGQQLKKKCDEAYANNAGVGEKKAKRRRLDLEGRAAGASDSQHVPHAEARAGPSGLQCPDNLPPLVSTADVLDDPSVPYAFPGQGDASHPVSDALLGHFDALPGHFDGLPGHFDAFDAHLDAFDGQFDPLISLPDAAPGGINDHLAATATISPEDSSSRSDEAGYATAPMSSSGPVPTTVPTASAPVDSEADGCSSEEDALDFTTGRFAGRGSVFRWKDGTKTRAPWCLSEDGRVVATEEDNAEAKVGVEDPSVAMRGGGEVDDDEENNALKPDSTYVRQVAGEAEPAEKCTYFDLFVYNPDDSWVDFGLRIRKSMRQGHFVQIKGLPPRSEAKMKWEAESVNEHFGVRGAREMDTLDANLRMRNALLLERNPEDEGIKYHVRMTMGEFVAALGSDRFVRAVMDAPSVDLMLPPWVKHVDDGFTAFQRNPVIDPDRVSIPKDVQNTQSWLLFHDGRFFTYPHYDSNALGTWVQMIKGHKIWVFTRNPDIATCETRAEFHERVDAQGGGRMKFVSKDSKQVERYFVVVGPGDVIIQPPGQIHEVYTPEPTACAGGHFYTIDAMHMTEAMLRYDYDTKSVDTNFHHASTSLSMIMMINGLKDSDRNVYPRKGLAALCRLVLNEAAYFADPFVDPDLALKNVRELERGEKPSEMMDDRLIALQNAEMMVRELNLSIHQREDKSDEKHDFVFENG
ncbi:hypothetical protein EIP91_009937, partial [Steccherinum ochraceum]